MGFGGRKQKTPLATQRGFCETSNRRGLQGQAASDFDRCAVDVAGFVGGQEGVQVGDFFRLAMRFIGTRSSMAWMIFPAWPSGSGGDSPGHTALARMPFLPSSLAQVLTKPITPNLVAA